MTQSNTHHEVIENRVLSELEIGQSAELSRYLQRADIELFAAVSGDINPAHLDEAYAETTLFHSVIAHGMWSGALISAVLGTKLPGPGTIYLGQSLRFRKPIKLGDHVTARVEITSIDHEKGRVLLNCVCINQAAETVLSGEAEVLAPKEKIKRAANILPKIKIQEKDTTFAQNYEPMA